MLDRQVESAYNIDFSNLQFPMITVYKSPKDYPGMYVARVYDLQHPTNTIIVKQRLEELQRDILKNTGMLFIRRFEEDDPSMVGVWV